MTTHRFRNPKIWISFGLKGGLVLLCIIAITAINRAIEDQAQQNTAPISETVQTAHADNPSIEFTLDAEVVSRLPNGSGTVFFVEYRGNPNYRILQLREQENIFETAYQVPKGHLIYSLAATKDQDHLIIAYSKNIIGFENGIYRLDLNHPHAQPEEILAEKDGITYTDLNIADSDSFWVSVSDSSSGQVVHSIAQFDFSGNELQSIPHVINPVVAHNTVYFLPLEEDNSRRTIGYLDSTGAVQTINILDGAYDLDDFLFIRDELYVAVLNRDQPVIEKTILNFFSMAVSAHGNHSVPATWVKFSEAGFSHSEDTDWGAKIIFDSIVLPNKKILEITNEGLEIIDGNERELVIQSRALRFAAK